MMQLDFLIMTVISCVGEATLKLSLAKLLISTSYCVETERVLYGIMFLNVYNYINYTLIRPVFFWPKFFEWLENINLGNSIIEHY